MEFGFPAEAAWVAEAMSLAPGAAGLLLLFERPDAHLEAMTLAKVALAAYPRSARCLVLSAACDRRRILALCLASGRNGPVTVIEPGHAADMALEQWDSQWTPAATVITGHVAFGLALVDHPVHIVEHLLFMVTAVIFWWVILSPIPEVPRPSYGWQMFYVLVNLAPMKALGGQWSAPL